MKLLCLADLHGDPESLQAILDQAGPVDLVLVGGDITHFATPNAAESMIRLLWERQPRVLAVAGNCDSPRIDQRLAALGVSLFRRGACHGNVAFCGVSAVPPWHGRTHEMSETLLAEALEQSRREALEQWQRLRPAETAADSGQTPQEVLLTHVPPHHTSLDRTRSGQHIGSTAVREFIVRRRPALAVCGHVHESPGTTQLEGCHVVNCGPAFDGCYALAALNPDVRIELRQCPVPGRTRGRSRLT